MPDLPCLKVALKLNTPSKVTGGHYRLGVVGNCSFLGDGDPPNARIGQQTSTEIWVVEIWMPENFVFEYRWVEFKRCTSFIYEIESIEPRRVEVGLRSLEIRNKFNILGGTFKEDIGHPVYFTSFCAPKRSLESSPPNARPRPCPPCRPAHAPAAAASKKSSTSRELKYSQALTDPKRPQASDVNSQPQKAAVGDEILMERLTNASTLASSSSSEDNASDDGSYSLNLAATRESMSTEVINTDSDSSHSLTSIAESAIHMQTASSDDSLPSRSSSVKPVHLSLPSTSGTYVSSVSLVARPCSSSSAQSLSRRRPHSSVSAPCLRSCFYGRTDRCMEPFVAESHDLELTQRRNVRSVDELYKLVCDNETQCLQEKLTNRLKEYLKTTFVLQKKKLSDMLIHLAWLVMGAAIDRIWLRFYELNYP
ncbi:uncharacterized protein LOC127875070 [Dreissena polymorpha]|uniref:Uncharacterized protein n=1 Tax=Dreissena polymorpha TaxID=45954 RepID=A0A9D4R2L2_DREPO|nr:uncharacterized protein LOC127875070 [Dreissena polymorpha]XP_052275848.1 uncharacterized protein LOC127875070 [Dreissena polymorpha]XP_052275849.1 uncharacterized protein LOC127875070 [Dreissena polymorpha]XP_052275850.1 uncharacterized protein LOC127875070 [Dreissena polymorpha]KAH3852644.1 hypothetical protein DPMN_095157 [Dreissena polymorpha]